MFSNWKYARAASAEVLRQGPEEKRTARALWPLGLQLLRADAILVAIAFTASAALGAAHENVQVNQVLPGPFPRNRQNEPSLAQNPTNPMNLIAGANDDIGEPPCTDATPSSCQEPSGISSSGFYASFDGGKTWPSHCQGLIDLSAFKEFAIGDPWQTFDSKGNAYYATLALPTSTIITLGERAPGLPADVFVAKSTDGGCTYPTAAKVDSAAPAIDDDKDSIAADANLDSPFRDNLYAVWTTFVFGTTQHVQIVFSRSTDGGATWSNPAPISPAFPQIVVKGVPAREAPTVKVGPDGTVYVAWVEAANPIFPSPSCAWPFLTTAGRPSQARTLPWPPLRMTWLTRCPARASFRPGVCFRHWPSRRMALSTSPGASTT